MREEEKRREKRRRGGDKRKEKLDRPKRNWRKNYQFLFISKFCLITKHKPLLYRVSNILF